MTPAALGAWAAALPRGVLGLDAAVEARTPGSVAAWGRLGYGVTDHLSLGAGAWAAADGARREAGIAAVLSGRWG